MDRKQEPVSEQTIFFAPAPAEAQSPEEAHIPPEKTPGESKLPSEQKLPTSDTKKNKPTIVPQPKRKGTSPWSVTWSVSKYIWKIALGLVLVLGILLMGMVGYLTVTEYNPAYAETADRGSVNRTESITNRSLSVLSFNTGYGALGEEADFFMDGGKSVFPDSQETVEKNMNGIERILKDKDADFILLQEVDTGSKRSFDTKQWLSYEHSLKDYESRFALNYSCDYVPYPFTEPLGKVQSGLATYSAYDIVSATRYALPTPFSWPTRTANLKRCLLVTRIPIDGSEQQLVLINVHMEAYDDGTAKNEQTRQLLNLVKEEYKKGNYVIAGGDFNQTFPKSEAFPVEKEEFWTPGKLESIFAGWQYAYDDSTPTCRLLNQPYDPYSEDTQYYVIDGFLVSPNVTVDRVETLNYYFRYSDHNPVLLEFTLNMDSE